MIAGSSIAALIIVIVVAHICFKLSKTFFLILGADIAAIIAILAWVIIHQRTNRRRRLVEIQMISEGRELRIEYSFLRKVAGVPTKFRIKELEEATDNFQALIGQGASASVFKGILNDGTSVAVKRIEGEEHGEKEFRSEVAAIASVQHVNLVRLIGYCSIPNGPRYLVYDFIPNGSLDCWIFPRTGRSQTQNRHGGCLSWPTRYKVAVDVARALSYLHHDCRARILHLDIKPENILLDENHRAIVSDFGLAKLMNKEESRVVTTIRGTRGYLAPEWLLEHGISEKSDVFSYGMVLLEIIGGRRNVSLIENGNDKSQRKWEYFPRIVSERLREGKLVEVVDSRLLQNGDIDEREVKTLVYVALWCIQENARLRPSMAHVVEMLDGRVVVEEPPDTHMIIVDLLDMDNQEPGNGRLRSVTLGTERVGRSLTSTLSYSFTMSTLSGR